MNNKKMLVVYNTCGIKRDNTAWYINCIDSILKQNFQGFHLVVSSCLNSPECISTLAKKYKNKISYCHHSERQTVNVTFNKAVQEAVKKFGEFESYLYVDSGCTFEDKTHILSTLYESYKKNNYGMVTLQVDTDEGLNLLDSKFKYESEQAQITGEDYIIPVGKAVNAHVQLYDNEIFKTFNNKLIPDVFVAFCTESTFSFLSASVKKRWAILKDIKIKHVKGVDGASVGYSHVSQKHKNPWNNLFGKRDALQFINDAEAIDCGLGYEECSNIMMHKEQAYMDGIPLKQEKLIENINKYFFLSREELDYDKFLTKFI